MGIYTHDIIGEYSFVAHTQEYYVPGIVPIRKYNEILINTTIENNVIGL